MENLISLKEFLDEYGESMAEKVTQELSVVHDPIIEKEKAISELLHGIKKKPFPSQGEIIKACYKSLILDNKAVYTVCEMGTGKTLMAISTAMLLHKLKSLRRVLVVCPPHLVPKWIQEIKKITRNKGLEIDEVIPIEKIPVDPRHHTKIDYKKLKTRYKK